MSAVSVQITEAVKESVNAGSFCWEFDCKRLAFPNATIQEADGLLVSVFSGPRRSEYFSREQSQWNFIVYLLVQRKLPADEADVMSEVDSLTELVEEIELSLEGEDMADFTMVGFSEDVERVPFNVELLRDASVFTGIVAIEYQGYVAIT